MKRLIVASFLIPVFALLSACKDDSPSIKDDTGTLNTSVLSDTSPEITEADLHRHIKILASDEFEGRAPFTEGETKTLNYLEDHFKAMGLEPVNGSYRQSVPLVEITADANSFAASITQGEDVTDLRYLEDITVWTKRVRETIHMDQSEMVFVGFGIVAPEYDWNDYEGMDVTGKTVVMLINDPGFATGDPALFNGKAMTYYGRWTYKFEEASRQGAAAAIIIHQTKPAAYPWEVVTGSWSGPQFDLLHPDEGASRIAVEGWITEAVAQAMFKRAGTTLMEAHAKAIEPGFKAFDLGQAFSAQLNNTVRHANSANILGMVEGTERPDEAILYMAHWDHLGIGPADASGDNIYNGALDNASGVAGLLELAQKAASDEEKPRRSMVFVAVTAEEQGLLGSAYYAANPAIPPERTVAAINMDGINLLGPMADITIVGWGQNSLQDDLIEAARTQDRTVEPEPTPEQGSFYRSDHFELAKIGIPVLYADAGVMSREHGRDWALAQREAYIRDSYHKPSDEYDPNWDLSGAVDDLELYYIVGRKHAQGTDWPTWYEGSEFRAARLQSKGEGM